MTTSIATGRRVRLRPTVEAFAARDGHLYLLRGGATADFVIRDADPGTLRLFELLAAGWTSVDALPGALAAATGRPADARELRRGLAQLRDAGLLEDEAQDADRLAPDLRERLDRQLAYFADLERPGLDRFAAQRRLTSASVLIIGVGGLGAWTAAGLACAGVGRLVLADADTVSLSNLNRQILFREDQVGEPKVRAAAEALRAFHPALDVLAHDRFVTGARDVRALADGCSAVVATADHPPYLVNRWINEACCALGVPWICAGQFPPLLRVGPLYVPGETACLECQERDGRRRFPLYDELAEWRRAHPTLAATTGAGSGLIGSLAAGELVHLLTGLVRPATAGRALTVDMTTLATSWEDVARDPTCPCCGPPATRSA